MIHLYSDSVCPFSHQVRIVLHEKEMDFGITDINITMRQDLAHISPYNETPVLVDDIDKNNKKLDLILSSCSVICEYIDDRFPHPQLMPIAPAEKARLRMAISDLERRFFVHVKTIESFVNSKESSKEAKQKKALEAARKALTAGLDNIAGLFAANKKMEFFGNHGFTLLDASLLPILWRLNHYGIPIKKTWAGMLKYAETQFARPSFLAALTPAERNMRT